MPFGIYIHIPYCLQHCPYCDFAKYEEGQIPGQDDYTQLLLLELSQKSLFFKNRQVSTIYFGGGTPSLLSVENFRRIMSELHKFYDLSKTSEVTMEINPGTLSKESLTSFYEIGLNRFSVGAQTFNKRLLEPLGRKHSVRDTEETLRILLSLGANFSLDLLFGLAKQSLQDLLLDIEKALSFSPQHISTYLLNIPEYHRLGQGRPKDDIQVEMFGLLENKLVASGYQQYEISNFSKPGFESQHNLIYWSDVDYLGLGLSSHSYFKNEGDWGARTWNSRSYAVYEKYALSLKNMTSLFSGLPSNSIEHLLKHQSMTEFCYTRLRRTLGFSLEEFKTKFSTIPSLLIKNIENLSHEGLLENKDGSLKLTDKGRVLSNVVFQQLTFLEEDLY